MKFIKKNVSVNNGKIIAQNLCIADTARKRLKGLMWQRRLPAQHALLLIKCGCIHTFFMKFPIDVICLNKNMQITGTFLNVRPNSFVRPIRGTKHILELPAGTLSAPCVGAVKITD